MILGEKALRELYPGLDDNQYQPAGIDLKLGNVKFFYNKEEVYGIVNGVKQLPEQKDVKENVVKLGSTKLEVGFMLEPHKSYIGVVKNKVKIPLDILQLYYPRSSLLRAGVDVRTAVGDPGFDGHLSFLIINHNDKPFFIKKDERFAQMVCMRLDGATNGYDGDYNE